MKAVAILLVGTLLSHAALAEVNYREVKTPNGAAYGGTFKSNGASGGFGGGYSSGGFSGGYGGSINGQPFSGVVNDPSQLPFGGIPSFDSFINPGEFEKLITGQFENLQKGYASGVSMIHATPGASAYASTSLSNNDNLHQKYQQDQERFFNALPQHGQHAFMNGGGGSNYASASSSYGPGGVHQTASVYPENFDAPNVDTRFGGDGGAGGAGGKPGFYGVSSSSFFESSNVDGVEKNRKGAITTVNENGKVTTYKAGF